MRAAILGLISTLAALSLVIAVLRPQAVAEDPPDGEVLWPDGAPGAKGSKLEDRPFFTLHLPPTGKANGTAVVICPGGSYNHVVDTYEGNEPAEWLSHRGAAGLVLHYRVAPRYHHPAPMLDVQRAIRMARARAKDWNLDPKKIGVWGFSAGGHLAATAATHFDDGKADAADPIDRLSCRPDFAILCYPVISLVPPFGHDGSRNNLLGPHADAKLIDSLCNDKQVTSRTPPTFLFHTNADEAIPAENSILFYTALRKARVPAELHVYEKGRHGVGLGSDDSVLTSWPARLEDWMKGRGFLAN
jgi:acetyl esterase/lipase